MTSKAVTVTAVASSVSRNISHIAGVGSLPKSAPVTVYQVETPGSVVTSKASTVTAVASSVSRNIKHITGVGGLPTSETVTVK